MNGKNLVICDSEPEYARHLMEVLSEKREFAFQIRICTTFQNLLLLSEQEDIDILLIEEIFPLQKCKRISPKKILVLARTVECEQECAICKYQSAEVIYNKVLELCMADAGEVFSNLAIKGGRRLLGVYSPIHRIGKTSFAILLGKESAKKHRTLYLNMQEYAGSVRFTNDSKNNLTELLYYARQEEHNFGLRVSTMVSQMGDLDYVPPVPVCMDLKTVKKEEWIAFIQKVMDKSIYETVILDIGESVQGLLDILSLCNRIYVPYIENEREQSKLQQYEQNLQLLGYEEVMRKMLKFKISKNTADNIRFIRQEGSL